MVLEKNLSTAMNARIVGSGGEAVVLAHGYGGDQSVWDKIVPYLAQLYRVLVFDWPFSGAVNNKEGDDLKLFDPAGKYSSYDAFALDLIALLDEFNLKSTVFVGHSMSGMIGCIASVKRPDLFKSLILIGASPRYINIDDYEGGFEMSDITQIISAIESNYHNWAANFAALAVDTSDPLSVEKFVKCLRRMRPEIALALAKTVFYSDHRDIIDKVSTPCTIISTSSDVVAPKSVAFYMQKKMKENPNVEIMNTDGHFPQLTAHLELLDVLGQVLGLKFDQDPYIIG
ncbi:strigolactone esterase D14-like protein [Pyrus ussuriensis x Pyrus communis]|uniref:Strigolactone esterase D14-like protein n=1 Tax=Pyrus ussuriensis x Pyrus communis TaxID=2448454 RepID=A0A5N5GV66_9ROSA|nr:strigolactone esterase D14-like protein [Pyrus ussuriensis x Pyrus communis]